MSETSADGMKNVPDDDIDFWDDIMACVLEPMPGASTEIPPSCLTFNWEDLMNIAIMGGDPAMLPQPEHIIDAMQAELDKAEARGDDITSEFFGHTLRLLEECALLSKEQINRFGYAYHNGLVMWPDSYKYDIPADYDEWNAMNRRKQRQAKEMNND